MARKLWAISFLAAPVNHIDHACAERNIDLFGIVQDKTCYQASPGCAKQTSADSHILMLWVTRIIPSSLCSEQYSPLVVPS